MRIISLGAVLAASLATTTASAAGAPAPRVDHHQHLLSPAGAEQVNPPELPEVATPPEIGALLARRAALTQDPALATLFAPDAIFFNPVRRGWIRGAETAAATIRNTFAPGYRLTPVRFVQHGDTAEVQGYYTRGEGPALRHPGFFALGLARGPDGWQITSEAPMFPGPNPEKVVDAAALIALLDEAGIRRAVVLSDAYYFDGPEVRPDAYAKVRAENDWTANQVAMFPDRLVAACSFNPLAPYALEELKRCAASRRFVAVKLHFGSSAIDLKNPQTAARVREVFAAANAARMPLIVHITARPDYGRADAEVFLKTLLPATPDVPVTIAHLWGGSAYSEGAMAAYADAVAARAPATRRLYFDVAQISMVAGNSEPTRKAIVGHMRRIGFDRLLYGSDGPEFGGLPPKEVWADFTAKMPLTRREFDRLAANVAPYLKAP